MGLRVILASGSPRRRELMKVLVDEFEVITSDCDETITSGTAPADAVKELSRRKAAAVAQNQEECIVIGSDTVVSIDGRILGKPKSEADAFAMLKELSGRSHEVYSGVCIIKKTGGDAVVFSNFAVTTVVTFNQMTDDEIWDYIKTGDPMDKAGAYGIQGPAGKFISCIEGDYYNVVGFPISSIYDKLKQL